MAKDMFGGLGGLMKGFSAFMPQDDPNTKIFTLQSDINDLSSRETELYAEMGKKAYESLCNQPAFGSIVAELKEVQGRMERMKSELAAAEEDKEKKDRQEEETRLQSTCPSCGAVFEPGVKFCNECGTKLGLPTKAVCPGCGFENPADTKFCGECGYKL